MNEDDDIIQEDEFWEDDYDDDSRDCDVYDEYEHYGQDCREPFDYEDDNECYDFFYDEHDHYFGEDDRLL